MDIYRVNRDLRGVWPVGSRQFSQATTFAMKVRLQGKVVESKIKLDFMASFEEELGGRVYCD